MKYIKLFESYTVKIGDKSFKNSSYKIQRKVLFEKIKDKILKFIFEIYPDLYDVPSNNETDVDIHNRERKEVMFMFFIDPIFKVDSFEREYSSIIKYINSEIIRYGELYHFDDIKDIKDKEFILNKIDKREKIAAILRLNNIEKFNLSKEEYELWLNSKKFGL